MKDPELNLDYKCSSGEYTTLKDCYMYKNKAGRYCFWSEKERINLAWNARTRDECLLNVIGMLLFTLELKDKRMADLERVANLAYAFADQIKPTEEQED